MNNIIKEVNKPSPILPTIEGHFEPGYIYRNPITHKTNIDYHYSDQMFSFHHLLTIKLYMNW